MYTEKNKLILPEIVVTLDTEAALARNGCEWLRNVVEWKDSIETYYNYCEVARRTAIVGWMADHSIGEDPLQYYAAFKEFYSTAVFAYGVLDGMNYSTYENIDLRLKNDPMIHKLGRILGCLEIENFNVAIHTLSGT